MRVALDGDAESSAQAQVGNLEGVCAVINQQVLGLQISVHYPVLVAMGYSFEQLIHEVLQSKNEMSLSSLSSSLNSVYKYSNQCHT